jgi:hypothetical protein
VTIGTEVRERMLHRIEVYKGTPCTIGDDIEAVMAYVQELDSRRGFTLDVGPREAGSATRSAS